MAALKHSVPAVQIRLSGPERREQLIEVAIDLFSRKGFKGTTTREIAAAAGVTEAIIFRHFATKEHLYTAIIDYKLTSPQTAQWVAGLTLAMQNNDDEAVIRGLIGAIVATSKLDPKFERLMLYAALEGNETALLHMQQVTASIADVFRSYITRRQKQGRISRHSPEAVLMAIVGMARQWALGKYVHEFKDKKHLSEEQAIESFTQIAMHGICLAQPPKPRPLRSKR